MQILQGDKILQPSKIPMELIGMQIRSSKRFEITILLRKYYLYGNIAEQCLEQRLFRSIFRNGWKVVVSKM